MLKNINCTSSVAWNTSDVDSVLFQQSSTQLGSNIGLPNLYATCSVNTIAHILTLIYIFDRKLKRCIHTVLTTMGLKLSGHKYCLQTYSITIISFVHIISYYTGQ